MKRNDRTKIRKHSCVSINEVLYFERQLSKLLEEHYWTVSRRNSLFNFVTLRNNCQLGSRSEL